MLHRGKTVLVTGGSRGLGKALALEFARQGANIAITYLTECKLAEAVVSEALTHGVKAVAIQANLSDTEAYNEIADAVFSGVGGIDILVANAATGVFEPMSKITVKHWQKTMTTNAFSLILLVQKFVSSLQGRKGSILAISSAGADHALPQYGLVGASKGALEAIVRHLALELGPMGIRVNALAPGLIETDLLSLFKDRDRIVAEASQRTPLGKIAKVEEVATIASFLVSSAANPIHGQVIHVDGGYGIVG